jgi:LysM repeat protein
MNTPNPLVPQGSLHQHQAQGKSTIRIAVFTIITIHAVFFTGLLLQSGCRPEDDKTASNAAGAKSATNNEIAKLDPGYYSNSRELPSVATNLPAATNVPANDLAQTTPPASPLAPTSVLPPMAEPPAPAKEYAIAKGDTLGKIAKANGVTVAALNKANPGLDPSRLRIGQKIQIPAPTPVSPGPAGGIGFTEPGTLEAGSSLYVVKAGDTLGKIAQQHGTTIKAVRAANGMKTDRLLVGQKIKLPPASKAGGAASPGTSAPGSHAAMASTNILTASPVGGGSPRSQ